MYKNKSILTIIPARSGSKRIPNKNILDFGGKPLVAWTIEAGQRSRHITELMVNTDSEEIQAIAGKYNCSTPFTRPFIQSTDHAHIVNVLRYTVGYYESVGKSFDFIMVLQPTSPLRTHTDIDNAIELLFERNADAVVSVCETECPTHWCNTLPEDLSMGGFLINPRRSQDYLKEYRVNGAIYICRTKRFLEENTLFIKDNIYAYIMGRERSIDIDEPYDMEIANYLIRKGKIS